MKLETWDATARSYPNRAHFIFLLFLSNIFRNIFFSKKSKIPYFRVDDSFFHHILRPEKNACDGRKICNFFFMKIHEIANAKQKDYTFFRENS